jgi:hypothetical protein
MGLIIYVLVLVVVFFVVPPHSNICCDTLDDIVWIVISIIDTVYKLEIFKIEAWTASRCCGNLLLRKSLDHDLRLTNNSPTFF